MDRTLTPTRLPKLLQQDQDALYALLDEVLVGYVGVSLPEGPLVVPISYARDGDRLLFHGSTGGRRMRALAAGAQVCFTVTALDGLMVARTAFGTGMQYRSACIFGTCELVDGEEKQTALERYTDRYLPGRTSEVRPMTKKEIAATMVLALPLTTWSLKVETGFPEDEPEDLGLDAWAGVVPLRLAAGTPVPNPDLGEGIEVPASVRQRTSSASGW